MSAPMTNPIPVQGLSEALLPCPFCGSKNVDPTGWASTDAAGPACDDCGASCGSIKNTVEQNVAAWNTRALATELQHSRAEVDHIADVGKMVDGQYVGPFTKCRCGGKRLELRGKFWCCTECGASYGEHAGLSASPASPSATRARVMVRPLEWERVTEGMRRYWRARDLGSGEHLWVNVHTDDFEGECSLGGTKYSSSAAAMNQVEDGYQARILSALVEQP